MTNLHTHTYLCRHAAGTPAAYAAQAEKKGIGLLGFSDHVPFPDDRMIGIRMYYAQLDQYLEEIEKARQEHPAMRILSSAECEYDPVIKSYYREVLLGEKKMDYLVGTVHFFESHGEMHGFWDGTSMGKDELAAYAESYVQMLESGLFLFGAHPDTFGAAVESWNDDCRKITGIICKTAARLEIPLEINTSGWLKAAQHPESPQPYPLEPFWQIAAEYGVKAVVNSDAHAPEVVDAYLDNGYRLAKKCGVELCTPIFL